MAVSGVGPTNPTVSSSSAQNLQDYGFEFAMKDGKVQITNTGKAPLDLGATAGSGQADLGKQPPLNKPIGVGQTVTIDIPDGWNGNFYRKTDGPEGKPDKQHPANMLEVSKTGGHLWWDTTAIDGVNTAMYGKNSAGQKVGIDQNDFKQLVQSATASNDVVKNAAGVPTAVKAPTLGDVGDDGLSASDAQKNGWKTQDWYGHATYVKDPRLEKLYRQFTSNTYVLPDDDKLAMNQD